MSTEEEEIKNVFKSLSEKFPDNESLKMTLKSYDQFTSIKFLDELVAKIKSITFGESHTLFDSIIKALCFPNDGNDFLIISTLAYHKVFTLEKQFRDYMSSLDSAFSGLQNCPDHYENILDNNQQSLIFNCIFCDKDDIKKIKEEMIKYFKINKDDIMVIPVDNEYDIRVKSIIGSFKDNKLKIKKFIAYMINIDKDLSNKIRVKTLEYLSAINKRYLRNKIATKYLVDEDLKSIGNDHLLISKFLSNGANNGTINITINNTTNINNVEQKKDNASAIRKYINENAPTENLQPSDYLNQFKKNTNMNVSYKEFNPIILDMGYKIKQNATTKKRYWMKK